MMREQEIKGNSAAVEKKGHYVKRRRSAAPSKL